MLGFDPFINGLGSGSALKIFYNQDVRESRTSGPTCKRPKSKAQEKGLYSRDIHIKTKLKNKARQNVTDLTKLDKT